MLADRLYAASVAALGSDEHLQIAGLLREAERTAFDAESCLAVREAFTRNPWSFECNLDAIEPPSRPIWLEWPNGGCRADGEESMTGCLFAARPGDPGAAVVVTGWDSPSGPRHAFAVALLDVEQLYRLAFGARTRFSRSADESIERMIGCVSSFMPNGFADEVEIVSGGDPAAVDAAMRDATADIPFALALLVALAADGGPERAAADGEGNATAAIGPPLRRSWLASKARALAGLPPEGFFRKVKNGRPALVWYR